MFLRLFAFALVSTCAFAQDFASILGPDTGNISQAVKVSTLVPLRADAGWDTAISISPVEPDQVMEFARAENGRRFTLLRYDGSLNSPVRLHFSAFQLPEGAQLFIYNLAESGRPTKIAGPYEGAGPQNMGEFWSGAMPGGRIIIELQVTGEPPPDLPFYLDAITHVDQVIDSPIYTAASTRRTSLFRGRLVDHEVHDGVAVFEGDMLLDRVDELTTADVTAKRHGKEAVAITSSYYHWPGSVIPYVICYSVINKTYVTSAISHWNNKLSGVISLIPRSGQTDYVIFKNGTGCSSYIGRVGGAQSVNISSSCTLGAIIHEIGHTVGLYHEHAREDRN